MLAAERYDRIVELVNIKGSMRVSELSERCRVTEETIRRDLDRLEQAGRLRRSHGGAVSVKEDQPEIPYRIRETTHALEKNGLLMQPWPSLLREIVFCWMPARRQGTWQPICRICR